jgi:hypothetical protein
MCERTLLGVGVLGGGVLYPGQHVPAPAVVLRDPLVVLLQTTHTPHPSMASAASRQEDYTRTLWVKSPRCSHVVYRRDFYRYKLYCHRDCSLLGCTNA